MNDDDSRAARRAAGRAVRTELLGDAPVGRGASDILAPDLSELSEEALWGGIWARPGVDLRTKSLCTITALLATERYPYAKAHMVGARHLGIPIEELTAVIVQLTFYVGMPVVHTALKLAAEVYEVDLTDAPPGLTT